LERGVSFHSRRSLLSLEGAAIKALVERGILSLLSDAAKQEEAAGHDNEMTRSIQGKPAAAAAAAARATSFDPSTDNSSVLEAIGIQAADMHQTVLSNFQFPSFLLPREGDSIQPHRYESMVPAANTAAVEPPKPIAYSNDDAFQPPSRQSEQFYLYFLDEDSRKLD
jgi:hypothetical protein